MLTVWLPGPEWVERLDGLPGRTVLDFWSGGDDLPATAADVEVVVKPYEYAHPRLSLLRQLPKLRFVQTLSAAVDSVLPYVPPGVTLCNARGLHDTAVAEWVVAVVIGHLRNLSQYAVAQRDGTWDAIIPCDEMAGKTVLIVGYGSIGRAVEQRLAGWEVTVERVARRPRPDVCGAGDLPSLLPRADVVIVLVPVTEVTKGMVDAAFLAMMHDGALLVNAARGTIVNTEALLTELNTSRLRAAIDVTDPEPLPACHPLWSAPGLLLTPHVAGFSAMTASRTAAFIRDQLTQYAGGLPLKNVVGVQGY
jgi:phosphoglycerate dehydrogenase-like enzyme